MTDGDDTYHAEAAIMTEKVLIGKADMVTGDRLSSAYHQGNKRLFHNFGNRLAKESIQVLFQNNIKDIMTCYCAISYEFVKTSLVLPKDLEIETEMSIHAVDENLSV